MSPMRARYAAEIFLAALRREFVRMNPGVDCPVKVLDAYETEHQGALARAVAAACKSAEPTQDKRFENWERDKKETASEP